MREDHRTGVAEEAAAPVEPRPAAPGAARAGRRARGARRPPRSAIVAVFSATLLLSAALLFLVQPMFARFVLPLLGSTPAVWNTSLLFFQATLLAGYLYAHVTTRRLGVRRQAALHLGVVLLPLLVLPIAVPEGWSPPAQGSPLPWLLAVLAVAVGAPFFVVASTAPLLQRWLADTDTAAGRDPYFLYRASNAGSIVGLLGYPLALEPALRLADQGRAWAAGYGLLVVLVAGCAVALWRSPRPVPAPGGVAGDAGAGAGDAGAAGGDAGAADGESGAADGEAGAGGVAGSAGGEAGRSRAASRGPGVHPARRGSAPTLARRLRWVALAFAPSSLMLGVTTFLTTDLAPVPLLWTGPLTLYLLSFVVVFSPGRRWERARPALLAALPLVVVLLAGLLLFGVQRPLGVVAGVHLLAFFAVALACHGELARDRPAPRFLTGFYLWVALGGALGGAFNAVVAPLAFDHALEYPLALVIACLLLPNRSVLAPGRWTRRLDLLVPIAIGATVAALLLALRLAEEGQQAAGRAYVLGLGAGVVLSLGRRPVRFGLGLAALLAAGAVGLADEERVIFTERSFFGVHRVDVPEGTRVHRLLHGTTLHGAQDRAPGRSREPLTYYHRTGPLGELMGGIPDRPGRREAAVIGLGTGTMACYSRPGERWTFYEIDPTVERIARDPRLFTYLRDCPGSFPVVLGDARLSLRRAPDRRLGLLVVDAFNSDAIPVHLLTREALDLYGSKLVPGGVLAFNISNRYLDLEPVLGELAHARGLTCLGHEEGPEEARGVPFKLPSHWLAMARRPADLGGLAHDRRWRACARDPGGRAWTDDYSNLLAAL